MNYLSFLGAELKSDEILDFLETYELEVIYDFDRIHENTADQYWVTAQELGMQLRFDERQILKTIFLYLVENDGFTPVNLDDSDIRIFKSKQDVRDFSAKHCISVTEGEGDFIGIKHDWIKLDYLKYSIHYDFSGGSLNVVTLSHI